MGLFDTVDFPREKCPACGRDLGEWQTKDPKDGEEYMRLISVEDIMVGGTFYAYCYPGHNDDQGCGTMVTYHLKPTGYTLERVVEARDATR
jgi:hypothetical protein